MKIGVARVSTDDQNLDRQVDALQAEGCDELYVDKISGKLKELPQLEAALKAARSGDVMVFPTIDRIARTRRLIYKVVDDLEDRGVDLVILEPRIDTRSVGGKIVFAVLAALAEAEAANISRNTIDGLKAARRRGRIGGRPRAMTDDQVWDAIKKYETSDWTWGQVARHFKVPKSTLESSIRRVDPPKGRA